MGKKYTPSGYQIIDIACSIESSPTYINREDFTDDELILYNLLKSALNNKRLNKPILLNFHELRTDDTMSGFVIYDNISGITLSNIESVGKVSINVVGEQLGITYHEQ